MSAIWGCVDISGRELPEGICAAMEEPLHQYKIDRYASVCDKNIVMGCGIQYVTPEAKQEALPLYDKEEDLYFTADCMVDNRTELIKDLCPGADAIPDGELMFLAYKKWRDDMPKHVLGAYSYAVYEAKFKRLIVGADHLFNRSIYYSRSGSRVYFSTVIESIIKGTGEKPVLDEVWITMFLSITSLAVLSNPIDTPYKNISRVQASHYMIFEESGDHHVEYWSPRDVKPLRLKNEEEYKERFRALMEIVAREVVRSSEEVGIFLSSGLDSSTVASFAEPILSQKGKNLYSYTCVPIETHRSRYNSRYIIANEQEGVELICQMYPGIIPKFLSVSEQNAISSIRRILPALEVPYKSHTNMAWIDAFAQVAAEDDCRIMLTGQMGNATISAGDIFTYTMSRILQGRLFDAAVNLNRFSIKREVSRKRNVQYILGQLVPGFIRRMKIKDHWGNSYIDRAFARGIGVSDKDSRTERNLGILEPYTFELERSLIFNPTAMAQIGEDETKLYLKYGMITRDITRDIRIFEFCLSAPMECFVGSDGQTRRLVRYYLSDRLPTELIDENAPRGRQSDDWLERLALYWDDLYPELVRGCTIPRLQKYIDREKVKVSLDKFASQPIQSDEKELLLLCAVYAIGVFLEREESL